MIVMVEERRQCGGPFGRMVVRVWHSPPLTIPAGCACWNLWSASVAAETPTAPAMERGVSPAWRRPTIKARMFGVVLAFL